MTHFTVENDAVWMHAGFGPIQLTDSMCEGMLDLFECCDEPAAKRLWNALYESHRANGGMERVSSRKEAA